MTAVPCTRSQVLRSAAFAAGALAAVRAACDIVAIAKEETLAVSAPFFLLAFAETIPFLALASLAGAAAGPLVRRAAARHPDRCPLHPLALFFGIGAAFLVGVEAWLRGLEGLDNQPGPLPFGMLAPLSLRAAGVFAIGAPALVMLLGFLARRLPPAFPGRRALASLALLVALACGAAATAPGALALLHDRTTRAARLAHLDDPPNILLIVLDTVRSDRISCYGFPEDVSPEIDRLAREGVTFSEATTPAPWTLPAHASLFTGLYPSEHGAHYAHMHLDDDATTIAEVLAGLGYRALGFSKKTWLSRGMGTVQGFERYRDLRVPAPERRLLVGRLLSAGRIIRFGRAEMHTDAGGAAIAENVSAWLRGRARRADRVPFFLFVNFNEAHLPFLPPRPYYLRYVGRPPTGDAQMVNFDPMPYIAGLVDLAPDDVEVLRALYAGEIAYIDRQIGSIVAALEETGDLDRTIVVITSDHGENIGDHALFGHVLCVYDTLLRIPLVIRYPARFTPGTIDARSAQLTDLLPTIVQIVDPEAMDLLPRLSGRSLIDPGDRGFAVAEYQRPDEYLDRFPARFPSFDTTPYRRDLVSLEAGTMKLIEGSDGRRELYDLAEDPGEERDLTSALPERVRELAQVLANFRERLRAREEPGERPELDAETREELRRLGYVK